MCVCVCVCVCVRVCVHPGHIELGLFDDWLEENPRSYPVTQLPRELPSYPYPRDFLSSDSRLGGGKTFFVTRKASDNTRRNTGEIWSLTVPPRKSLPDPESLRHLTTSPSPSPLGEGVSLRYISLHSTISHLSLPEIGGTFWTGPAPPYAKTLPLDSLLSS